MELVKRHDRPEEEEWEVEVVLEEVEDGVDALALLAALEGKAHAAHDGEGAASVEKDILEIKSSCYKPTLHKKQRVTTRNVVSLLCCLVLGGTPLLGQQRMGWVGRDLKSIQCHPCHGRDISTVAG